MPYFHQDLPEWSREKYALFLDLRKLPAPLVKVTANAYYQNTYKDFHHGDGYQTNQRHAPSRPVTRPGTTWIRWGYSCRQTGCFSTTITW
jgi:hypothetical protein